MKRIFLLLCIVLFVAASPKRTVAISAAWMREPNPARPIGAAFMTLQNPSDHVISLVSASSPAAKRVELHEMSMDGGMMRMRQVRGIAVPARGRVQLAPGGLHLMMFDLTEKLHRGDKVDLRLTFDDGTAAIVRATVRAQE